MKELSIEEKARAYDEAIERAIVWRKKYVNFTISEDGIMLQDFDNIFPELKESEDERTWIINYLSNKILNSTIIAEKENLKKAVAWLEKQGEQKHAEWSEEDERMCTEIIFTLAGFMGNEDKLDWLKSLKDRYTWKPSDEQMETLVSAIDVMIDNRGAGDKNTILLSGLYHELKTL